MVKTLHGCKGTFHGDDVVIDGLASRPTYIYSVGSSLVLVDTSIEDSGPHDVIRVWPRVVVSGRRRVQALATHVERALVYFSDTEAGAIYRTQRNQWTVDRAAVRSQLPGDAIYLVIIDLLF